MKKFIAVFTALTLILSSVCAFAIGEKAGNIYATDIVTYVKGAPITSYNIGGKTVIDAAHIRYTVNAAPKTYFQILPFLTANGYRRRNFKLALCV